MPVTTTVVVEIGLVAAWVGVLAPYIWSERKRSECDRRERSDPCRRCGYSLTGNVSGVCPECGMRAAR
jgi:hypothetical protein